VTVLRLVGGDLSLRSPGYAWTTTPSGVPDVDVATVPNVAALTEWACREAVLARVRRLLAIRPHLFVLEDIFAGKNSKTGISLAKLHGVIEQELGRAHVPYVHVHQAHRAMYATGRGDAPKPDVLSAARYVYGRFVGGAARIRTTDDADALVLLAMAADYYGQPLVEVDQTKRRALAKVRWPRLIRSDELPAWMDESSAGIARRPDGTAAERFLGSPSGVGSSTPVPAARFSAANPERTTLK